MSERPNAVATCSAVALIVGGALVCIGWEFRISILRGEFFGTFVSPNAALLFILVGTSCLLQLNSKTLFVRTGQAIGILIAFFAALMLMEHLLGGDFGIDRVFLSHRLGDWKLPSPPGRIALPTLSAFLFTGIGLISIRTNRVGHATEWCSAAIAAISYLAFVGYGYSLPKLYGGLMALPTAVLLGIVAIALSTVRSDSVVTSKEAGGVAFRRVITPLLILMPLLGFIRIQIQQTFSLSLQMGTALLVVATVFLFAAITAHTAGVLNELDLKRKRAEESLIRAEKLAAAGRLSATIAHEINNPLASVTNLLYLARTADDPDKSSEYIRTAEDELRRAAEIAKRTLAFYRDDTQPVDVNLSILAREVLDRFHSRLSGAQIRIETDLRSTANVRARPGEIRQILANLLVNAIDAVESGSDRSIGIAVRDSSGSVQLVVRDNGVGIPSEQLHRVFEPFFTTKKDVGTGLGLYVSRQLAEKNGGYLQLESSTDSSNRGTAFYLTLPIASSAAKAVPA